MEGPARAGYALALVLLALAWPRSERRPEPCLRPAAAGPGAVLCERTLAAAPRLAGPARRLFGLPIDPNRADPLTLETLPGIGPARARAILAERCRRPFESLRDLRRVRGLGPKRVDALRPFLGFGEPLAAREGTSVDSGSCRSSCGDGGNASEPLEREGR